MNRIILIDDHSSLAVVAVLLALHDIELIAAEEQRTPIDLPTHMIRRLQKDYDAPMPIPDEPFFHNIKPYGKNARRQLRGGRHD